jgi:hypothetical protein
VATERQARQRAAATLAGALLFAATAVALGQSARRAPAAVVWSARPGQPTRIEVMTVQQSAAGPITQCADQAHLPRNFRLSTVFETSGRLFWTSADSGSTAFLHCVAMAARRTMALQPFNGTQMLRVEFPIADTHWEQ